MNNPKQLFLLDCIGAVISAFFLGGILVYFESNFGMPRKELFYLAGVACLFAIYSLTCHLRLPKNWQFFLKIIAFANLVYCIVSIGLVIYHFPKLTKLGVLYFVLEFMVVLVVIGVELKTAFK